MATPSPKPVIPLRPLSLREIFVGAFRAARLHWKVSIGSTAVVLAVGVVLLILVAAVTSKPAAAIFFDAMFDSDSFESILLILVAVALFAELLMALIGVPIDATINGICTITADRAIRGAPVRLGDVVEQTKARFLPLCRLMVLYYSICILSGIVPALAFLVGGLNSVILAGLIYTVVNFVIRILLSLSPIVVTLEQRGVMSALKRSIAMVKPALGRLVVLHLLWVGIVFATFFVTTTFTIVLAFVFPFFEVLFFPLNFLVIVVAAPVFRTLQTLVYTDLLIRDGSYQPGIAAAGPAEHSSAERAREAFFHAEPYHAARLGAGLAVLPIIIDPPGISWLIIVAGCLVAEWYLRTRRVQWNPQIRMVLTQMRLADAPDSGVIPSRGAKDPAEPGAPPEESKHPAAPTAKSDVSAWKPRAPFTAPSNPGDTPPIPATADAPTQPRQVVEPPPPVPTQYAQFTPTYPEPHVYPRDAQKYWPPPPPGGSTSRKDQPRRRGPLAVLAAVGVVALLVSSGAVWWLVNRDESTATIEMAGQLRDTFPVEPTATWAVDANQIFSNAQFVAPIPSPTGSNTPGFIDLGNTLVTTAYLPQSDRDSVLVAVDTESGTVNWRTSLGFNVTCASRTVDDWLPCFRTQGFGPDHVAEVVFLNMNDGSIDHRIAASGIERVEVVGDDVVTAGYRGIARGSATDLTEYWYTPWESHDSCPGSGDAQYFGADDEFVHFGTDAGSLVVRASDGKRVIDTDAQQVTVYPGHGLVAEVCSGGDSDNRNAVVLDSDGAILRSHSSEGGFTAALALDDTSDRYVVDGAAYDFATGTRAWSYGSAVTDIVDDTALVLTGGPLTAVDLDTGEIRWTHDFDPVESYTVPFLWLTDSERVLFEVDDNLRSVNLANGALEWTTQIADGTPRPAGDGFAVASGDEIVYYAPTGGYGVTTPTLQPDGSTQLITKCGKAPEMTPVQYRTDSAALAVRMELRARCLGGDIVSTDALRVLISENGQPIAAGVFDVSSAPIYLPPTSSSGTQSVAEHEFYFPVGSFWRLPNSIGAGTARDAQTTNGSRTQVVECVDIGTSRGPTKGELRADSAVGATIASRGALPTSIDGEAAALDALRAQADADRPSVQTDLADRWLPQLSSKRVGLVAPDVDGRMVTWSATEILNQHLRMRLQYPEVRLVWSDEWSTFDLRGWWVTIAGTTFPDANAANGWCDSREIPVDECFAKLVSNSRDSSGTTQYRR